MPLSWLDFILIGIMLLSGLLAMMRGLTREVLSITSWGGAAVAGFFAYRNPQLKEIARSYVQPENHYLADIGLVVAAFFIVLVVLSVITIRISDRILDSRVGALDRSLGFLFGLARGLLIVVVAFLFYAWLIPKDKHFIWVKQARTLPIIERTGDYIVSFLPPDTADALLGRQRARPVAPDSDGGTAPPDEDPDAPENGGSGDAKPDGERGASYDGGDRKTMNRLVEGTASGNQQ